MDALNGYAWDSCSTYTAQRGDSWDLLANLFYEGNSPLATVLIYANPEHAALLLFHGGEQVRIPNIRKEESKLLPPWKRAREGNGA